MKNLTARFILPGDAFANPREYIALLNVQVGNWNRSHMANPVWGDVSFGQAVQPPRKPGAQPHREVYAQVTAAVSAGHDLYDVDLARGALLTIACHFDAALRRTESLLLITDTVIIVGYCQWHRDAFGVVSQMTSVAA